MIRLFWPVAVTSGVLPLYLLRLDPVAGLFVDDAWYIVLAKAIASGQGYELVSSATGPILPAVPPGFPLLLAPVFAISPDFPANVMWLKAVSIAAMLGVGLASYVFLARVHAAPRLMAGAVALITVIMPAFVFLATSTVMAECAFTLGQLVTALAIERAVSPSSRSRLAVPLAAALGVATLLIRSAGVAGLMTGALYLAMKRGWRSAAGFAAVAALCYLPWALYGQAHRSTAEARLAHGGSIAYSYSELLSMRRGGLAASGQVTPTELPQRVAANVVNVFGRDMGAVILPSAYRGADESGLELLGLGGDTGLGASSMGGAGATMLLSLGCSALVVIGFLWSIRRRATFAELLVPITLAMVVLVPNATFRYVLPLTPFLLYYFFRGIEAIAERFRRLAVADTTPELRIGALCLLVLLSMEHVQYVWQSRNGPAPMWLHDQQQVGAVVEWVSRNLAPGHIASTNPGLLYLLTGRLGVAIDGLPTNASRWSAMGVRYVVALRALPQPSPSWGYQVSHSVPAAGLWVAEVQPTAR